MSDATTERRRQFEQLVYKRLAEYGIGNGSCSPKTYRKYLLIRTVYRERYGKAENGHRLTTIEFERLCETLDGLYPPKESEQTMSSDTNQMNEHPLIHILPQESWHDHAAIVGNLQGLTLLRDLFDAIIQGAYAVSSGFCIGNIQVFCNDGEGYEIFAAVRPDISDVPLGYTYEHAKDDTPYPEWLISAIRSHYESVKNGNRGNEQC
jgi:hypothetical protein